MKKISLFTVMLLLIIISIVSAKKQNGFLVTRIIDGDTIKIETGQTIRLICVNTPEKGEEGYKDAKSYLKSLILNKRITIKKDISEMDSYDRLLRYVYLNKILVNEAIARKGYGSTYPYEPDTKLCTKILKAEQKASR